MEYELETDGMEDEKVEAATEYYDMSGRPVAEPVNGIFIRKSGERTDKVLIR